MNTIHQSLISSDLKGIKGDAHWNILDQRSLNLKLVFGCVRNFYVGCIQTGHMDFLPLQVCGRSQQRCRLGIFTCHEYGGGGMEEGPGGGFMGEGVWRREYWGEGME